MAKAEFNSHDGKSVANRARLASNLVAGITLVSSSPYDVYEGTKEQLIAQGLAQDGQFPGDVQCGAKVMATYAPDGSRIPQGGNQLSKDAGAYQIQRAGKRFRIVVTPEKEERERRLALRSLRETRSAPATNELVRADNAVARAEQVLKAALRLRESLAGGLRPDPGHEAAEKMLQGDMARFEEGARAIFCSDRVGDVNDGAEVVVTSEYKLWQVWCEDGPFICEDGQRAEYRWGYGAKLSGSPGERFYEAHKLRSLDGSVRHLRLVLSP